MCVCSLSCMFWDTCMLLHTTCKYNATQVCTCCTHTSTSCLQYLLMTALTLMMACNVYTCLNYRSLSGWTERERERERRTDGQTDGRTDGRTDRHRRTDRQIDRQTDSGRGRECYRVDTSRWPLVHDDFACFEHGFNFTNDSKSARQTHRCNTNSRVLANKSLTLTPKDNKLCLKRSS